MKNVSTEVPEIWLPRHDSPEARALECVTAESAGQPMDEALRVTVNFHPDRLRLEQTTLEALLADGNYRSQFETGTSNGALSARERGSRWHWESRIFGGAYDHASQAERPKYGALNHRWREVGGSPRFGSAHLRLKPAILARTSFCYPDSVFEPSLFGVAARMALLPIADADDRDDLDNYIEAHIHGPLRLACDVEALVLDPSYRGSEMEQIARALPCALEWHDGFRLHVGVLREHSSYRGPEYVELGLALARDEYLTPAIIAAAARTGQYDPQALKKVWHCLARFGAVDR
jgi:hypothetical protein